MKLSIGILIILLLTGVPCLAVGVEEENTCRTTTDDPCHRRGTCSIQGADWYQDVTVDRAGIFDTQGWPGLCDMVHVALVQGNCEPPGGQVDVVAYLSGSTFATITEIIGPLACAGTSAAAGAVPDGSARQGTPLDVDDAGVGQIRLSWAASCASGDDDYEVYHGVLGDFGSHVPLLCTTGGATSVTFTPAAGDIYYLIVPCNATREGSYGLDSSSQERPPGSMTCLPQEIVASCP